MALAPQEQDIGLSAIRDWIGAVPSFFRMEQNRFDEVIRWMIREEVLWSDSGILALGRKGEYEYGRRNFLKLYSVFLSPPVFTVLHGRQELGSADEMTFLGKKDGPRVLLLGGRAWLVKHIDWMRRMAYVEATEARGRSRWKSEGRGISYALSQAIHRVLVTDDQRDEWSQRARGRIAEIRQEYAWLDAAASVVLLGLADGSEWWTFAGSRANGMLASELSRITTIRVEHDDFALTFEPHLASDAIEGALEQLRKRDPKSMRPEVDAHGIDGLKFSECLPRELALDMLTERLSDPDGARGVLARRIKFVSCGVQ
jgi:ATP-dependent Lhr-like helicase